MEEEGNGKRKRAEEGANGHSRIETLGKFIHLRAAYSFFQLIVPKQRCRARALQSVGERHASWAESLLGT